MNIIISGSLAYDRIMDFPGYFSEHILPEKVHILNVCFQVNGIKERFGGTAGNIAYALTLMGEKPWISATIGQDDHKYIEWISGIPSNLKANGQMGKYILKKSLEPYLPNDVLYRKKMGFAVPLANWFRGPLKERVKQTLLGEEFLDSGMFNTDYLKQLVDLHQSGIRDNSASIWTLMMLESFQRQILNQ